MNRPASIVVVSVIIIAWAAVGLLGGLVLLVDPEARAVMQVDPGAYLLLISAPLILLVSGLSIMRGKNWGRLLFVMWGILNFGISLLAGPFLWAEVIGLVLFGLLAFFLFRPEANAWFRVAAAASTV
jgi:hypothetical protein